MIKSIIFDLYGTLLQLTQDSTPFLKLARRNSTLDFQNAIKIALTNHCPTLDEYANLINLEQQKDFESLEEILHDDLQHVELYPDSIPTLKALKKSNIRTAVISNLATPYKKPFSNHKLEKFFDAVIFSCDCGYMKPNPQIYKLALDRLGSIPHETIMVGDSLKSDVIGPSKLGIVSYHLVRSDRTNSSLTDISSLDSLPDKIMNL